MQTKIKKVNSNSIVKANQGENPLHETYFPKKDVQSLKFYLYPEIHVQKLREKLGDYSGYPSENIFCTNGSDEGLMLLIRLFTKPGEEIIVCPPTFFKYDFYGNFCRVNTLLVTRKSDFSLDINKILKIVTPKTKMIIIDSPGNPCGATITKEEVETLLKTDITVVIDECYFEYCGETVANLVHKYPNLVITRTFSKWAGMAGLRVGYIIAQGHIIKKLLDLRFPLYINTISQHFACYALDHKNSFLKRVNKLIRLREFAIQRIKKYPGITVYPSKSPFVLIKLNDTGNAQDLQKFLEQEKIYIFVINQPLNLPLLANSIRVNLSTKEEINRFCSSFENWLLKQKQVSR